MGEIQELLDNLVKFAALADNESLKPTLDEVEFALGCGADVTEKSIDTVIALLGMDSFLRLEDSWRLVRCLDNNWDLISSEQRDRLRAPLAWAFDKHASYMGAFVISEIIGGRYADDDALRTLKLLDESAQLPARSLAPHGLEMLAREASDPVLRQEALARLRILATSNMEEIRAEASESLARILRGSKS